MIILIKLFMLAKYSSFIALSRVWVVVFSFHGSTQCSPDIVAFEQKGRALVLTYGPCTDNFLVVQKPVCGSLFPSLPERQARLLNTTHNITL